MNHTFWVHIEEVSSIFTIIFILSISNHYIIYDLLHLQYCLCVSSLCTHRWKFQMSKVTKQHQWSFVILIMIQYIPCKWTQICHVVVESNLYFSYTTVLLHYINRVMTRVVCRPFTLMNSFDHHGSSHILFVVEIIQSLLSALL